VYNSFVDINVVNNIKKRTGGKFFACLNPDMYSAFCIAGAIDRYLYSFRPLTINGAASKSNGTNSIHRGLDSEPARRFLEETQQELEPGLILCPSVEVMTVDAFLKATRVHPRLDRSWLDYRRFIAAAAQGGVHRAEPQYEAVMDALTRMASENGLREEFNDLRGSHPCRGPYSLPSPGYHNKNTIVFDAGQLAIADVADAAGFVGGVLDLMDENPRRFERLLSGRDPEIAIARAAKLRLGLCEKPAPWSAIYSRLLPSRWFG
jgi:hypothetical protein